MSGRGVLRIIEGGSLGFWCPGCECMHAVDSGWTFNGDYDKPTFSPSVLVTGGHYSPQWVGPNCYCNWLARYPNQPTRFKCSRCHTFVVDGQIQFLADSTHALAGQTVPLEPLL